MNDYISREDAINLAADTFVRGVDFVPSDDYVESIRKIAKELSNNYPSADVEERNAGTWIIYNPEDIGTTNCRCSKCRTEFFYPTILTRPYAYCPACGARMEG